MASFEEMANDEAMAKFIADNTGDDGVLSPDAAERLLAGDYGDTGEPPEGGDAPDSTDDEQAKGADEADNAGEQKPAEDPPKESHEEAKPAEDEQKPVVKAKDGVHEIPYKVVEDLRTDNKSLRDQISALSEQLEGVVGRENAEKLADAQEQDKQEGTTEASDDLIADLKDEFPEAAKLLMNLNSTVSALQADKQQAEQAKKDQEEANAARGVFEKELAGLAPNYKEAESSDEFWKWADGQPSYVRAALDSADPQQVADVIKTWEATIAADSDKSGKEPPKEEKPKVDPKEAKKKVDEAVRKAEEQSSVRSLTDIPGGTNTAHDEAEAIANMDGQSLLSKWESQGWSQDKIERHLNRVL